MVSDRSHLSYTETGLQTVIANARFLRVFQNKDINVPQCNPSAMMALSIEIDKQTQMPLT